VRCLYYVAKHLQSDMAEVARKHFQPIVCLFPALRLHDLTPGRPFEIWFAIPNKAWHPARRP
jgi:predicted transcriptional regulator of viral defense system